MSPDLAPWLLLGIALAPWPALVFARHAWAPLAPALLALAAAIALASFNGIDPRLDLPWLLLGTGLRLDAVTGALLLMSALLWSAAAFHHAAQAGHDPRGTRFRVFFLLAMAGNFWLLLAADALGFFLGYALMGLSAAGLVAHRDTHSTRHATRAYLAFTVLGETVLFAALAVIAANAPDLRPETLRAHAGPVGAALLLFAFAIKLAAPGLHLWLPLAYRAAPAPGAAVMAGAMMKAGVLGLILFLPWDQTWFAGWSPWLMLLGITASLYGVAMGLMQTDMRTVLAYSSLSQMGWVFLIFGIEASLFLEPAPGALAAAASGTTVGAQQSALIAVLVGFAVHHGLVKGALFLVLDRVATHRLWLWPLGLLALALAGAPLTSGWWAKGALKIAVEPVMPGLGPWLMAATAATTLLMARLLYLAFRTPATGAAPILDRAAIGPLIVTAAVLLLPLWLAGATRPEALGALPVLLALGLAAIVAYAPPGFLRQRVRTLPPGDLPALLWQEWRLRRPRLAAANMQRPDWREHLPSPIRARAPRPAGASMSHWARGGALLLSLIVLAALSAWLGTGPS
ncbi:MAG: NADH/ubiquinone/plastoquinone (complex I) [Chromatiales bacterium]|nr:NADH/ubiquinone/plastoquinone (complex I) [Gammaproteobacteria bacterium]MCP5352660.1 NADH/ubiquinone/plastoquinone (complex I) [Chromatiales bacterium]